MLLDFEKPITLLEEKLHDVRNKININDAKAMLALKKLEAEFEKLCVETFNNLTRWQRVQLARHPDRPYTLDYIKLLVQEFTEIHGDRYGGDDKSIVTGLGTILGRTFMIIGQQKGRNLKERKYRNFGMVRPQGYRKSLRAMKIAEKFNKPIIIFIDTPGAYPGIEAEEFGQAEAIAKNIQSMFTITVPIICIVIGEGASGGALGIGIGDKVFMLEHSWYSVISPESCASILWKDNKYKEQAADELKLTADDMLSMELIDDIIKEPINGAHRDYKKTADEVRKKIMSTISELDKVAGQELVKFRREKFCKFGNL
jgi:acetyl-CoA carboxylase carboxyl transferase subunit alpha